MENKKRPDKSFCLEYDKTSERMVMVIYDKDGMFPLVLKVPGCDPREILVTKNGRIQMR